MLTDLTRTDVIVFVLCLFAGYFLVGWLIGLVKRAPDRTRQSSAGSGYWRSADRNNEAPRQDPPPRPDPPPARDVPRPWHEVLGVPAYASAEDVKSAYRRRIAEYHPDRTSGLGDELRALAEAKTKEINVAYQAALRALGK